MIDRSVKLLLLSLTLVLCIQITVNHPAQAALENPDKVKELNLVFLHGMGGNPCAFQLLSDQIKDLLPDYIAHYQEIHSDTTIRVNILARCYPSYVDIPTWAMNVTESINTHFSDKEDLILIGHSMGGKTALYAVAHNTGNISNKVAAVVTINSPIRRLDQYYVPGGGPMLDYCRTTLLGSDDGICNSLAIYDSSQDGIDVSKTKHWLAFVSSEMAPLSEKFDRSGIDVWPRNMDDGVVPLPAQFSNGADVIYYGEYGHSDVALLNEPSRLVANQLLRYIFGYSVECSVIARSGILEHEADWLLGTDHWSDIVGGVIASTGSIQHKNDSYFKWQEWEDIIGDCTNQGKRSYSHVSLLSLPVITSIKQVHWLMPNDISDCRLYLKSRAAPRTSIQINWTIYESGLLPSRAERAFYDVEISEGTPLASIRHVSWLHDDPYDPVIWMWSEAQSPFRWFKAKWCIYQKESRQENIIDDIRVKIP
ncbi:esterase/lipase family protein [Chloroflexota bacterium]